MLGATRAGSIRSVLSGPAVARTFAVALVGRLAYGLLPLCLLFTIRDASGSFAVAASASAALGFATLAMPLQARLVDRHGQRRVLPWYAAAHAGALIAVALLSVTGRPDWLWVVLGVVLGVSAPALGPATRAQWREIAAEGPARRVAYSLDSVAEESLYLVGPVLASVVLATGPARTGLVGAAVLVAIGTAGLVLSPYAPRPAARRLGAPTSSRAAGSGVWSRPRFRALLGVLVLFGGGAAAALVGVAALADEVGRRGAVGLVEAAMALGAVVAGLAWTRLRREPSWTGALAGLLLLTAVAQVAALVATPHLVLVGAALVLAGAGAAPVFVVAFTAADGLVAAERRTEASTWVSTAINAGSAAGTALAGLALTVGGTRSPFALAVLLSVLAVLAVIAVAATGLRAARAAATATTARSGRRAGS